MSSLNAILFNVDGTLVAVADLHAQTRVEALQSLGIEVDIRPQNGKGEGQLLPDLIPPDVLTGQGEESQQLRAKLLQRTYLSQVTAFPGLRELIESSKASRQSSAPAPSGHVDELEAHKANANTADQICDATRSEEAGRSEPLPDLVEAAFDKSGLSEPIPLWRAIRLITPRSHGRRALPP